MWTNAGPTQAPTREQVAGDAAEWEAAQRDFMKRQEARRKRKQPDLPDPEGFEADWRRRFPRGGWRK